MRGVVWDSLGLCLQQGEGLGIKLGSRPVLTEVAGPGWQDREQEPSDSPLQPCQLPALVSAQRVPYSYRNFPVSC